MRVGLLLVAVLAASACGQGATQEVEETAAPDTPTEDGTGAETEAAEDLGVLRVAESGRAATVATYAYAQHLGIYEDLGLEVEVISLESGANIPQLLASGDLDIANCTACAIVAERGLDAKLIAVTGDSRFGIAIAVAPDSEIQSTDDLQGRTWGITNIGSSTHFWIAKAADLQGWAEGEDYEAVPLGSLDAMIGALQEGAVDAIAWTPDALYSLEEEGEARVIGFLQDLNPAGSDEGFFGGVGFPMWASNAILEERPEAVEAFVNGFFQAQRHLIDHPEESIPWMVEFLGFSETAVTRTHDAYVKHITRDGMPDDRYWDEAAENVMFLDPDITEPPDVRSYFDPRFVPAEGD